jgi:hypothetical protein
MDDGALVELFLSLFWLKITKNFTQFSENEIIANLEFFIMPLFLC